MNISISGLTYKVIAHKYAILVKHQDLKEPFKIVVDESLEESTGKSLGWMAIPEIQLRQTAALKQEYIVSNVNPTPEDAVKECIGKMLMTSSREIFYKEDFEEKNNFLWYRNA